MTMFERILRDFVFVDFGSEIRYGSDQICLNEPVRFATVTFRLIDTWLLSGLVDRIRKDEGIPPASPIHCLDDIKKEAACIFSSTTERPPGIMASGSPGRTHG